MVESEKELAQLLSGQGECTVSTQGMKPDPLACCGQMLYSHSVMLGGRRITRDVNVLDWDIEWLRALRRKVDIQHDLRPAEQ